MPAQLPSRRWIAVFGILIIAIGLLVSLAVAASFRTAKAISRIAITATPITFFDNRDPSRTRFGALEFRGGLVLTSDESAFGGFSAIHMHADGEHFLALTDHGSWLRGRLVYRNGRPVDLIEAEMAPMLAWDGKPLAAHGWHDAESMAELDSALYVGIERVERIVRFDYRRDGLRARGIPIPVPADFADLAYNMSLECLAGAPERSRLAGRLIVITERSLDPMGNHRSFLLGNGDVGRFSVRRSDDFDVSDCAILPPSDLLLLERRLSFARGFAIRIRRIALDAIQPEALVDGATLFEADLGYQIDNMEGLAVHRTAAGEVILTLISDDNFSPLQRNLLLQFALVGG